MKCALLVLLIKVIFCLKSCEDMSNGEFMFHGIHVLSVHSTRIPACFLSVRKFHLILCVGLFVSGCQLPVG